MISIPDRINYLSFGEMREGLKDVRLKGFPDVKPYQFATITLEKLDPNYLHPVQNYVLESELMKVRGVRDVILDNFGINILNLNSSIDVYYGDEIISVLPVIIEEHIGNDGRIYNLICDGAHRAMVSRLEQSFISCVYIRGINKAYPYYSKPRISGWSGIDVLQEIPLGYLKKWYAVSEPKKYYRDFNSSIFHNVGQGRGYSNKVEILPSDPPIMKEIKSVHLRSEGMKLFDIEKEKEAMKKEAEEMQSGNYGVEGSPYKKEGEFGTIGQCCMGKPSQEMIAKHRDQLSKAGCEAHDKHFSGLKLPELKDIDIYEYATEEKIKELREKTGEGKMHCRNALMEAKGDMEKAIEYLKKRDWESV